MYRLEYNEYVPEFVLEHILYRFGIVLTEDDFELLVETFGESPYQDIYRQFNCNIFNIVYCPNTEELYSNDDLESF